MRRARMRRGTAEEASSGSAEWKCPKQENGGALADSAIPCSCMNPCGQGDRAATASEHPSVGDLGRARDESLRASSEAVRPARVRYRRTSPTNTPRVATEPTFELDIGSPPQAAVGCSPTRTAHRSRAPMWKLYRTRSCGVIGDFKAVPTRAMQVPMPTTGAALTKVSSSAHSRGVVSVASTP